MVYCISIDQLIVTANFNKNWFVKVDVHCPATTKDAGVYTSLYNRHCYYIYTQ